MIQLEQLQAIFGSVEDPRAKNARHRLFDILFVALAATLCGAKTCLQMAVFASAKEELLSKLLGWEHGPPSHDTFSRVFRIVDPRAFETAFRDFTQLFGAVVGAGSVVALDGKAVRNAVTDGKRYNPLQLVNVWACEQRIALAQFKAPERNEVAGALEVLQLLSIAGTVVTADALYCRPDIASAILDKQADYVLALKANRPKLLKHARQLFEQASSPSIAEQKPRRSHGRLERRRAIVVRAPELAEEHGFPSLRAIACIQSWRGSKQLPSKPKLRYFLLSRFMPAKRLLQVVRSHWRIEANLHWSLDVIFGEDDARTCLDHAPENLAILRKIAINMLHAHPKKMALSHKVLTAACNDQYLLDLFANACNPNRT